MILTSKKPFQFKQIKHNRKNPYRNVSNDFNFFIFILNVLLELKKNNKSLSYEQFTVAMFSKNGNVNEFIDLLKKNKLKNFDAAFEFIKKHYGVNTKFNTITKDYPDVVRRVFIISGFITIRYTGKKLIQINEGKLDYIKKLLKFNFKLNNEQKENPLSYFNKLNNENKKLIELIKSVRKDDKIDGKDYSNKIFNIIKNYKINEDIIIESIEKIGTKRTVIDEFKEIPEPLKLEFFISIFIALKYGKEYTIRPNYKADHIGKPYSHAPGNKGDIEIFSKNIYWLIEVTLIRNKTQQLNHETANVIRHLYSNEEFSNKMIRYLSFVAPVIHEDVKEFFDFSIVKSNNKDYDVSIKPYSIKEFIETTKTCNNFIDMKKNSENIINKFKSILS